MRFLLLLLASVPLMAESTVIFYHPYLRDARKELEIAGDGSPVAKIAIGHKFVLRLPAGKQVFSTPGTIKGERELTFDEGKTYYMRANGIQLSTWKFQRVFTFANAEEGIQRTENLKLIEPKKVLNCQMVTEPKCR